MEDLTRRDFMGAMGAMGAAMGIAATLPAVAKADEKASAEVTLYDDGADTAGSAPAEAVELTGWTGTPEALASTGYSTMPLEELNRRRKEYVDAHSEYTCTDGTVIPSPYVRMHSLIETYGFGGFGTVEDDKSFDYLMALFTEDEATAYVEEMPWGQHFTAYEMFAKGGRPVEECVELLDHMAKEGFLERFERSNGVTYNHVPLVVGILEYQMDKERENPELNIVEMSIDTKQMVQDFHTAGSPVEYTVPCHKSVVADDTILPYDDAEAIIRTKSRFAIAPCYCRYTYMIEAGETPPSFEEFATGELEDYFSPVHNQRMETCLMFGTAADYWIWRGLAREITMDDALRYLQRSVDDGFIIQSLFDKDTENFCSCHGDSCKLFRQWSAFQDPAKTASLPTFQQVSHYDLVVDLDACIKCGTCVDRCPIHAITMDEESGYPVVNEMCFRCGQCGYVCPAEARKLTARPEELNCPLPQNMMADHNMKAAYRFEHGLLD